MHNRIRTALAACVLASASTAVLAEDIEGLIESIDSSSQSFVVQGIEFFVTPSTDYDDGLDGFGSLAVGQEVEVDFDYRDGRHYVIEVELEN
ncbi:MAG: DUF5666 domain-containing protein [Chromatiaceae bacterium]|jgi:hypothetical protein|nr:DUF5666 domain-containing protein [Chromatiaceae bacterium]